MSTLGGLNLGAASAAGFQVYDMRNGDYSQFRAQARQALLEHCQGDGSSGGVLLGEWMSWYPLESVGGSPACKGVKIIHPVVNGASADGVWLVQEETWTIIENAVDSAIPPRIDPAELQGSDMSDMVAPPGDDTGFNFGLGFLDTGNFPWWAVVVVAALLLRKRR